MTSEQLSKEIEKLLASYTEETGYEVSNIELRDKMIARLVSGEINAAQYCIKLETFKPFR